jgi:hypothetical protein
MQKAAARPAEAKPAEKAEKIERPDPRPAPAVSVAKA